MNIQSLFESDPLHLQQLVLCKDGSNYRGTALLIAQRRKKRAGQCPAQNYKCIYLVTRQQPSNQGISCC